MGEKLKDLIYDFSDIIISLIIITMIFGVVSWKISDSMAYTSFTEKASKATLEQKDGDKADSGDNTNVSVGTEGTAATGTEAPASTASGTDSTAGNSTAATGGKPAASGTTQTAATGTTQPASNTTAPASTTTQTPPANTAPVTEFKVDIPSGSAGITIAKILKDKGIIADTKMFITRVDQLKMGPKLKAGSFTIKVGSTLDEVIYTLAGKK